LHLASENGYTEVAALLVEAGADVNAKDEVRDSRLS
jgi:ankyrin repeat protein